MSWRRNTTIYIWIIQQTTTGLKTVPWFKRETLRHTPALLADPGDGSSFSVPWTQFDFVYCSHGGLRLRVRESKIDNRIVFITFPMGCNQENISSQDSTGQVWRRMASRTPRLARDNGTVECSLFRGHRFASTVLFKFKQPKAQVLNSS